MSTTVARCQTDIQLSIARSRGYENNVAFLVGQLASTGNGMEFDYDFYIGG